MELNLDFTRLIYIYDRLLRLVYGPDDQSPAESDSAPRGSLEPALFLFFRRDS